MARTSASHAEMGFLAEGEVANILLGEVIQTWDWSPAAGTPTAPQLIK